MSVLPFVNRPPRVYCAGKISKNDWRHTLFTNGVGVIEEQELFDPEYEIQCGPIIYTGPFFVDCDHGCFHGANEHGVGAVGGGCSGGDLDATHRRIFEMNMMRLHRADLVFAFIESLDAYGTLIELGVARALTTPIGLRLPAGEPARDLWMAEQAASAVFYGGSPTDAWAWFMRRFVSIPHNWDQAMGTSFTCSAALMAGVSGPHPARLAYPRAGRNHSSAPIH